MNAKGALLFACSIFAQASLAAEVEATRSDVFDKSPEDILEVLTDFENTCDSNCRYTLPGLEETKVLSRDSAKSVVWQRITNIQTVKQFVINTTVQRDDGTLVMTSSFPTEAEIAALRARTGLSHATPFRKMSVIWTMQPMSSGATKVSVTMKVDHALPTILNGTLRQSMDRSLQAMFDNFKR